LQNNGHDLPKRSHTLFENLLTQEHLKSVPNMPNLV